MNKTVVVDSDAIFAIYNPNDPLNERAIKTFKQLISEGYQLIYPTSVIFEVVSLFQRVLPTPKVTAKLVDMNQEPCSKLTGYETLRGNYFNENLTVFKLSL